MSKRIMLKVSGEQLGSDELNFDFNGAQKVSEVIESLHAAGYEVAVVMGGGNIVRGQKLHSNGFTNQVIADQMGMLATLQNGLFLGETLQQRNKVKSRLYSNVPAEGLAARFDYRRAVRQLGEGIIVLIAGGIGKPGFTTDTGVVAQAFELHCDTVVKATKVDGVYDKDPHEHTNAKRYERLSYAEVLANPDIQVMDQSAFSFAAEKGIRIAVCRPIAEHVLAILNDDTRVGTIVS